MPTEAPLSHRKHCSLNASLVVPPLILGLCDITLCPCVTHLTNVCLAAISVLKNKFCTAALLSSVFELTNHSGPGIKEAGLEETGA